MAAFHGNTYNVNCWWAMENPITAHHLKLVYKKAIKKENRTALNQTDNNVSVDHFRFCLRHPEQ